MVSHEWYWIAAWLVTVYLCGWVIQHCIVKWGVAQAVTEEQIITHHGQENKERLQWGNQTYLILTWRQSLLQSRGELQQYLWTERFWSLPHSTLSSLEESCEEECYCGQWALVYHLDIWHPGLCRHDPSKTPSAYSGRRGGTPGKWKIAEHFIFFQKLPNLAQLTLQLIERRPSNNLWEKFGVKCCWMNQFTKYSFRDSYVLTLWAY